MNPRVRVRAQRKILGMTYGDEAWVDASPYIDGLVRGGVLLWLDDPRVKHEEPVEEPLEPAEAIEAFVEGFAATMADQIEPSHVHGSWLQTKAKRAEQDADLARLEDDGG